ncbi:MAG: hypothetical protein ABIH41_06375 [Nanoarchaeota archaeon]
MREYVMPLAGLDERASNAAFSDVARCLDGAGAVLGGVVRRRTQEYDYLEAVMMHPSAGLVLVRRWAEYDPDGIPSHVHVRTQYADAVLHDALTDILCRYVASRKPSESL